MPTQDACDDYYYHMHTFNKPQVWQEPCRSWYKKNGKVWIWPGAVSSSWLYLISVPVMLIHDRCRASTTSKH